jgi:PPE-repeat protein
MLAAATAWGGLAAELELMANAYESVLAELAAGWTGPSATAMATAARPYVTWMHHTAALAAQTASGAHTAAAAFESAFAMTVPPPVIATNRAQLMALIATNFFGQNLPAIAATEAAYAAMWAQDATAMYVYAADSAGATTLTAFTPPPETTNPAGPGNQTAAAGQAAGTAAGAKTQQGLSWLQGLVSPMAEGTTPPSGSLGGISPSASQLPASAATHLGIIGADLAADLFGSFIIDSGGSFVIDPIGVGIGHFFEGLGAAGPSGIPHGLAGAPFPGVAPVAASMGNAAPVSGLSVPSSWTTVAAELRPVATAGPAAGARAAAAVLASASGNTLNEMAMASTAGLAGAAGLGGERERAAPAKAQRAKAQQPATDPIIEIGPELRELIELHEVGILTEEEFTEQKRRLLGE